MKFTRLQLRNIGAFYGSYDFDLRTNNRDRNVILIGGQNGSGKTTILEALRLALFGPLAFGYKTDTSSYYEKIDAKLNTVAKKNGEQIFQVILDLEIVENLEKNRYTLRRSWERNRKSIREQLLIKRNGDFLTDKELEIFQTKLREETPPQLFELCLFDGERISQIISDESLSTYLRETAKVMFNLDLFESLESDLNNLINKDSVYGSLSIEEKQLYEAEKDLEQLLLRKENLLNQQKQSEQDIEDKAAMLVELNKQFEVHGGLIKEKRDALSHQLQELEHKRRSMMERTKETISTIFPFVLIRDLVKETVDQMIDESVLDVRNSVSKMVSPQDMQRLVQSLSIQVDESNDQLSEKLLHGFLDLLSSDSDETYHHASYQQRAEVDSLYKQILTFQPEHILDNYSKNTDMLQQANTIRKKLDENDSASDLKKMINDIHHLEVHLQTLKLHIQQQKDTLEDLGEEILQKKQDHELLKTKIIRAKKAENVFVITNKLLDVSRAFREIQMQKKLRQVEWETTRMLQSLYRKELFINRVSIDPFSFALRLFNSSNEEINKEILSAGEKQILLLATVWAMVKTSRKRLPFVFDTLLGRLDQTHRKSLIQNLIPLCGEQVIILATDSEINQDDYKFIQPIVGKTYTIDFNSNTSTVDVTHQYFTYSNQEVKA